MNKQNDILGSRNMDSVDTPFTDAAWIGPHWHVDYGGEINRYYAFRSCCRLPETPETALVNITADARYTLWVNGSYVGRGPARCYPKKQSYDTYDLAPYLQKGENWIAVLVYQFGMSNGQFLYRGRTGLILRGEAVFANSENMLLRTDQ